MLFLYGNQSGLAIFAGFITGAAGIRYLARISQVVTRWNPSVSCVKPDGTHPSAAAAVWSTGFAALSQ